LDNEIITSQCLVAPDSRAASFCATPHFRLQLFTNIPLLCLRSAVGHKLYYFNSILAVLWCFFINLQKLLPDAYLAETRVEMPEENAGSEVPMVGGHNACTELPVRALYAGIGYDPASRQFFLSTIMSMKPVAIALAALAFGNVAQAADIVGAWTIDGSVFFNAVDTTCLFKGEGGGISATCENDGKPGEFTPATVAGSKVVWSWNSGPAVLTFTGVLASDTVMKGEIKVRGFTGKFTATKQSSTETK
jgi:hypothetical protein